MSDTKTLHIRNPEESNLCSGLYIVPTPIGNLRDITLRALDVFNAADVIVCEDSRVTGKLLKAYGLKIAKKITYNDHADDVTKDYILNQAREKRVALVSDAGAPMISDPGYKLVRDCMAHNIFVTALPGPNAILPALQLSRLPTDSFVFAGFLPSKDKAVRNVVNSYKNVKETIVFYESPKRIEKTCAILCDLIPNREMTIIREISKIYEESLHGTAGELLSIIGDKQLKGEVVLVINGACESTEIHDIDAMITKALKAGQSIKDVSAQVADLTGHKKKEIYNRALEIQNNL